jgi:hypothetical protein
MDAGTVTGPGDLEMALGNARDHRDDMVLWLALQVMMTDDVALADDALQDRVNSCCSHGAASLPLPPGYALTCG